MSNKKTRNQIGSTIPRSKAAVKTTDSDSQQLKSAEQSSLSPANNLSTSKKPVNTSSDSAIRTNLEDITFVCLDLPFQSIPILHSTLRSINDYIYIFKDSLLCLDWIRSTKDSIFFITSIDDRDLIAAVNALSTVEGIFILNCEAQISKDDFPKLIGVFTQHEELFMVLEDTLLWIEQVNLEKFSFEEEKIFLWSQLWKEERMNLKGIANEEQLAEMARVYYRGSPKALKLVETFHQSYRSSDALRWCFRSPFPSRHLNHALRFQNTEQLGFYTSLLNDASHVLRKQPKRSTTTQLYRGMKLTAELVDQLEQHAGKLMCAGGFFTCTKSRTVALALASSSSRRPDLMPVLFKIDCDSSACFVELSTDGAQMQVVFDVYTAFRVMCVNRGSMSVVKMKTALEEGRQMAKEYKKDHKGENIQTLLDDLLIPPKPPTPPPPKVDTKPAEVSSTVVPIDNEIEAKNHIACGEIDLALAAYSRIKPVSPRILNLMGQIHSEKRSDYEQALQCHMQALKMQEERGEDISDTLSSLGMVHYNRHDLDSALSYHNRAFKIREEGSTPNSLLLATSLRNIANTRWARHEHGEAREAGQWALAIHRSLLPVNETNVATSLATLANIYHDSGDYNQALKLGLEAITLLERDKPENSPKLASVYHNVGAFYLTAGMLSEARSNFERALQLFVNILPPDHPKRIALENHIKRIDEEQNTAKEKASQNDSHK